MLKTKPISFFIVKLLRVLRENMLEAVREELSEELDRNNDEVTLRYLLGNIQISPIVSKYLRKTMELRDLLIEKPKQLT